MFARQKRRFRLSHLRQKHKKTKDESGSGGYPDVIYSVGGMKIGPEAHIGMWPPFGQDLYFYLTRIYWRVAPINSSEIKIQSTYIKKYIEAGLKMKRPKFSAGEIIPISLSVHPSIWVLRAPLHLFC